MRSYAIIRRLFLFTLMIFVSACVNNQGTGGTDYENFDAGNFEDSANITNQWMPLKPGTQLVFDGFTIEEGVNVPHRIIITVTDLVKVIDGVRSVVTWDLDYSDGELVEAELAFFAQDKDGVVWRMGEYPEEYESGNFTIAPTWIHGIEDARAGIAMYANPQTGTPDYSQGWGPAVSWTDRGKVDQVGQQVCVPFACYENVLVIAETSKSEAGAYQLKFFAPNVGNIRVDWRGEDQTRETLDLVEYNQLTPAQMEEARAQAIELERHAYEVSKDVYGKTTPLILPDGTSLKIVSTDEATQPAGIPSTEIIVYASDLPESALFELDFMDDAASPEGKSIGLANNGDELDAPPENDPHVTFTTSVQAGIPYRCWVHMKVGMPKGKSQANVIWAQFSNVVEEAYKLGSSSYLTAQGPTQAGWTWVGCDLDGSDTRIYFQRAGEITVRLQAGAEGVAFDQFVLSSAEYLEKQPSGAVVEK